MRRHRALSGWLAGCVAVLLGSGCTGPAGVVVGPDYDASVWTECADEEGAAALQRGEVHLRDADPAAALPFLVEAVQRCPRLVRAHELYQDAALELGGEAEATMRSFYAALPSDPYRPEVRWAQARLLASNANRLAAVEAIIARDSSFPNAHLSQARLLRDFEKFEGAIDAFERALSLDRNLMDAHLELADLLVQVDRGRDARAYLEDYVRGRPTDRAARRDLVRLLLYDLDDPRAAEPHVEELLRVDAADPDTMLDQAAVHWRLDRLQEARATYQQVLRNNPENGRAVLNLANLYFEGLGRDDAGKREYWPLARGAYRYYLALGRADDGFDAFDRVFSVPYRLEEIDALLGPSEDSVPGVDDL